MNGCEARGLNGPRILQEREGFVLLHIPSRQMTSGVNPLRQVPFLGLHYIRSSKVLYKEAA